MNPTGASHAINGRAMAIAATVIVAVLLLVAISLAGALRLWNFRINGANAPFAIKPKGALLLSAPRADRAAFEIEKKKLINNYRWDGHSTTAAIPIDVATTLLVEQAQRGTDENHTHR